MPELKPCPFCGGEANTHAFSADTEGLVYWVAECDDCGATSGVYLTKEEAIEAWNGRVKNERI